ncbi:hypothetical protein RSC3_03855 [Bacillus paralicheniformis]|nr:hypothetical protein RSC3_03855 [Bacillus paralicheniformis]
MDKKHNYFIPSGLLIGLGIGILFDHPAPGLLIGLGRGFCCLLLCRNETESELEDSLFCAFTTTGGRLAARCCLIVD